MFLVMVGCATPTMLPHVTDLNVSGSNVVVIGRFELWPPVIPEWEQETYWNVPGDESILNTVIMATGATSAPVHSDMRASEWQASIKTQWGVPFMVEMKRQQTWLQGAMMQMDALKQEKLWFPGGLFFDVPATAKAVYIGTLRYTRDDFNNIVNVEVIDEYQQTLAKLGIDNHQVTRSLLQFKDETKPAAYIAFNQL